MKSFVCVEKKTITTWKIYPEKKYKKNSQAQFINLRAVVFIGHGCLGMKNSFFYIYFNVSKASSKMI